MDALDDRELDALASSSGDDCDMAAVECVVREVRRLRVIVADWETMRTIKLNALAEISRLRALVVEACDIGVDLDEGREPDTEQTRRQRLSAIRTSLQSGGGK